MFINKPVNIVFVVSANMKTGIRIEEYMDSIMSKKNN